MQPIKLAKSLGRRGYAAFNDQIIDPLTRFLDWIDTRLRNYDWKVDRNYAPKRVNYLHIQGHAAVVSLLMLFLPLFLIFGPTLGWRGWWAVIALVVALGFIVFIHRRIATEHSLLWLQTGVLLVMSLVLWSATGIEELERSQGLYRHILIPALWVLIGGLLIAQVLAKALLQRYKHRYAKYLKDVELFSTKEPISKVSWRTYVRSFFTAPLYHGIRLVFLPAVAVLLIADRSWMYWAAGGLLIVAWVYLAAADVHERLSMMVHIMKGKFFIGGQLVVSLVVIVLAGGRLIDYPYITTLIEVDPRHVNLTIVLYVLAAYLFLWFFEYWANRPLLEQTINIFRAPGDDVNRGRVNYPAEVKQTSVKKEGRFLQTHGGARFAVVGINEETGREDSDNYQRVELLDTLFQKLNLTQPNADMHDARVIKQRMRFYFICLNAYLVLAVLGMWFYYDKLPQKPELQVQQFDKGDTVTTLFNLQERLFASDESVGRDKAILLAASGGGTRAALYTQSVLHGLAQQQLLDDLVLGSGVSGGSVALAYFAAHRGVLLKDDEDQWQQFSNTMAKPFIQDVLEGVMEWRVVAGVPYRDISTDKTARMGLRLGDLLAESLEQHLYPKGQVAVTRLGKQQDVGLIFNTALVAQFPRWTYEQMGKHEVWGSCLDDPGIPVAVRESQCADLRTELGQGGRLIFTNLEDVSGFPQPKQALQDAPNERLVYIIVQDANVPLARAAALSANFPPVFPNSAVDVGSERRYWVTDGGASDNRGVLSLLYALRGALRNEAKLMEANLIGNENAPRNRIRPTIHVLIADASAINLAYGRGSGLDAKFSAPARFASQIMLDLAEEIKKLYASLNGKVEYYYLGMPLTLRSNGGLGTHWMLPARVRFAAPLDVALQANVERCGQESLAGTSTQGIIDFLHISDPVRVIDPDVASVWSWICNDRFTNHQSVWQRFVRAITDADFRNPYCPEPATAPLCPG